MTLLKENEPEKIQVTKTTTMTSKYSRIESPGNNNESYDEMRMFEASFPQEKIIEIERLFLKYGIDLMGVSAWNQKQ